MTSIALLPTQASAENTGEGDHPDVDYTPLSVDPEQADADVKMGSDEQYVKPEGRRGDTVARVAALVRLELSCASFKICLISTGGCSGVRRSMSSVPVCAVCS